MLQNGLLVIADTCKVIQGSLESRIEGATSSIYATGVAQRVSAGWGIPVFAAEL